MVELLSVEILTAVLGVTLLTFGLLVPAGGWRPVYWLGLAGLAGIGVFVITQIGRQAEILGGMYFIDHYGDYFKLLFLAAVILVGIISLPTFADRPAKPVEYLSLLTFSALGMMVMASAGDLVTAYLGLELVSLSAYILTTFRAEDKLAPEAGVKYLLLGAISSAVLLYGMSLLYGLTGSTIYGEIAARLTNQPATVLALIFLLAGFGFKMAIVPFHVWSPDVYEGAPTPVTAWLAVASKAAGFAVFIRVFITVFAKLETAWIGVLVGLAVLTMIFGNLVAIPQTNIKRLLAYSSIAQAGYLLVGVAAADPAGIKAVVFYAVLYLIANLVVFTVAINVGRVVGSDEIAAYAGLHQRAPLLAAGMLFSLLSLAGIPPLAGFAGKFYLFLAAVADGYMWLALIGLIMSMVSVYYYLMVVKVIYQGQPADEKKIPLSPALQGTVWLLVILTLVIGVYPYPLVRVAEAAAQALF